MARSFKQRLDGEKIRGPKYVKKSKDKLKAIKQIYSEQDEEEIEY